MTYDPCLRPIGESYERQRVVDEARKWKGTPYHHCADVRGVGVDCAMLLVRVFVDLEMVPPFDPRPYAPDWHLHRSEEIYINHIIGQGVGHEITEDQVGPGDLVVWKCGRTHSHGAIIVDWSKQRVIHALAKERLTIEGTPPDYLLKRSESMRFFSFWGQKQ